MENFVKMIQVASFITKGNIGFGVIKLENFIFAQQIVMIC